MKTAFYALAVVVLGIIGISLISLFVDVTVTNQQDYTLLKNSVEAAMYDSIDELSYIKGFCVCTNSTKKDGNYYEFDNKNDYVIQTLDSSEAECSDGTYNYCEKMLGEVKLNSEVFAESFVRRFAETVKGDKDYKIIVQEIIEYPPKVSVEVRSYDNYNVFDSTSATFDDSDFNIVNKIDSIFEYK